VDADLLVRPVVLGLEDEVVGVLDVLEGVLDKRLAVGGNRG